MNKPKRTGADAASGSLFPDLAFGLPEVSASRLNASAQAGIQNSGAIHGGAGPSTPHALAEWLTHIRDQEMPALGATVALVKSITTDEKASTDKLAQVILQDAAMTAKVLKLANSAYFNPARQNVATISRAIVVLGFDVVAEMAIGIRLVDALLTGGLRQRVIDEMAQSFHAAVLARAIAGIKRDGRHEEVFIATLLSRVGEMAFWAFGGQAAVRLDALLRDENLSREEAQAIMPGFPLRQLSVGLAREWKLGTLLQSALEEGGRPTPSEQAIRYAGKLALASRQNWSAPDVGKVIDDITRFVAGDREALGALLAEATEEAASVARYFGATEAALHIPRPVSRPIAPEESEESVLPDPMLQLRILREISGRVAAGARLNELVQLVLEGVLRGVGFDRVLFAMLTPNRLQLVGKAGLGPRVEQLKQKFIFTLGGGGDDLFTAFFRQPRALRVIAEKPPAGLRLERLQMISAASAMCLAPVMLQGQIIGLLYAERDQAVEVDDESFEAFQLFVQQLSLIAH